MKPKSKPLTFLFKLNLILLVVGLGSMVVVESYKSQEARYTVKARQFDAAHEVVLNKFLQDLKHIKRNKKS